MRGGHRRKTKHRCCLKGKELTSTINHTDSLGNHLLLASNVHTSEEMVSDPTLSLYISSSRHWLCPHLR